MITIYFVRHCESDRSVHDDKIRPLTPKGLKDSLLVTEFLRDKGVEAVLSSPYRRAVETVQDLADTLGLPIKTAEDFRERKVGTGWIEDFQGFARRQWEDKDYREPEGESLRQVQARNIAALREVLKEYEGKTAAVGSHGTALSGVINFYQPDFGFEQFLQIVNLMPWIVEFRFENTCCREICSWDVFTGRMEKLL